MKASKIILPIAVTLILASCSSSEITHYATTDMTWAEFYAAEVGASPKAIDQAYDAVTSATKMKTKMFKQFIVTEDGSQITGVKDVPVAMTESVYKKLSKDERYTFVTDTVFASYKQADKKGQFGAWSAALTPLESADASISSGSNANWGNYIIRVNGAQLSGTCIGVVLTCTDGTKAGLKPLENIWMRISELAFCVAEFTEPRGNHPTYKHTEALQGKTITNIKYLFKDADAVSIDTDLYVKAICSAEVNAEVSVEGNEVTAAISGLPEGYSITSVRKGRFWGAKTLDPSAYSLTDGKLVINVEENPQDSYRVDFVSDTQSDLAVSFDLTPEEE